MIYNSAILHYNKEEMNIVENQSNILSSSCPGFETCKPSLLKMNKNIVKPENFIKYYHHDENMKLSTSKLTHEQVKAS